MWGFKVGVCVCYGENGGELGGVGGGVVVGGLRWWTDRLVGSWAVMKLGLRLEVSVGRKRDGWGNSGGARVGVGGRRVMRGKA